MFELVLIVAVFLLIIFFAIKMNKNGERLKAIFLAFLLAFFAVQTVIFIQQFLFQLFEHILSDENSKKAVLFNSFIVTGFAEEAVKLLFFYVFAILVFNRALPKNLLLFALFYGLVFAQFENIAYMIKDVNSIKMRIFTATIFHTSISLYYVEFLRAKSKTKKILFFLIPILLHGFYNLFLNMDIYFSVFSIIILIFLISKLEFENLLSFFS